MVFSLLNIMKRMQFDVRITFALVISSSIYLYGKYKVLETQEYQTSTCHVPYGPL